MSHLSIENLFCKEQEAIGFLNEREIYGTVENKVSDMKIIILHL